jgi:hypothetical protein
MSTFQLKKVIYMTPWGQSGDNIKVNMDISWLAIVKDVFLYKERKRVHTLKGLVSTESFCYFISSVNIPQFHLQCLSSE